MGSWRASDDILLYLFQTRMQPWLNEKPSWSWNRRVDFQGLRVYLLAYLNV